MEEIVRIREELVEGSEVENIGNKWEVKKGVIPLKEEFPIMNTFGIPSDNTQILQCLLIELIKIQPKAGDKIVTVGTFSTLNHMIIVSRSIFHCQLNQAKNLL